MLSKLRNICHDAHTMRSQGRRGVMLAYHVWMDEDTKNDRKSGYSKHFFLAFESHSSRDD